MSRDTLFVLNYIYCLKFEVVVYYESIKRELNIRLIYECRCNARLNTKAEGSTRLAYTGLRGGLEHLKPEIESKT